MLWLYLLWIHTIIVIIIIKNNTIIIIIIIMNDIYTL